MTQQEWLEIRTKVIDLIGEKPTEEEMLAKGYGLEERINAYADYNKMYNTLCKLVEKYGKKGLSMTLIMDGYIGHGITPQGKRVCWERNHGYTRRSLYCGTLWIDGEQIFTSGTFSKCYEYMLNN